MPIRTLHYVLILFLAAGATNVGAAGIFMLTTGEHALDETTFVAVPGASYTIDIWMNFSGPGERTLGGSFDILFDEDLFDFVDYVQAPLGDPSFASDPVVTPGLLVGAAFGAHGGLVGPAPVASVTFTLSGELLFAGLPTIFPYTTSGVGGPFISANDFTTVIVPFYSGVQFVVPIPAAVWLFGSALLVLVRLRR